MSISFPYEDKQIDGEALIDPRVTLEVKTIHGFIAIKFLLDSGADVTTLPVDPYAELFGFQIKPEQKVIIGGVEGRGIGGYPFLINVRIKSLRFPLRCYFLESKIDPLLGRLDFWNMFSVHFDNRRLRTILTRIRK